MIEGNNIIRRPIKRVPISRKSIVLTEYEQVRFLRKFPETYPNGVKLKVQQLSHYFDILYSKKTKRFGYASMMVPRHKDVTDHKNWNLFYTLYLFLTEYKLEYKLYIESVFDAYKTKPNLPYPNMLYSDFALSYFDKYKLERQELLQEKDGAKQVAKVQSLTKTDSILQDVKQNVLSVREYLIYADKRCKNLEEKKKLELIRNPNKKPSSHPEAWSNPIVNKLSHLSGNYTGYSPWYIACIEPIREFVLETNKFGAGEWYSSFRHAVSHKAQLTFLQSEIEKIEKCYDVPTTWITSEELNTIINDVIGGQNG